MQKVTVVQKGEECVELEWMELERLERQIHIFKDLFVFFENYFIVQ